MFVLYFTVLLPVCVIKNDYMKIWISPKIRVLSSGTLSQTTDLKNFATASRSHCQQNSPLSSTVEFVDDTYRTVEESWLFTASQSTVIL